MSISTSRECSSINLKEIDENILISVDENKVFLILLKEGKCLILIASQKQLRGPQLCKPMIETVF